MKTSAHGLIYSFFTALILGWLISKFEGHQPKPAQESLVFQWRAGLIEGNRLLWTLSLLLLASCLALNLIWR